VDFDLRRSSESRFLLVDIRVYEFITKVQTLV
jgi:hypothetical protein